MKTYREQLLQLSTVRFTGLADLFEVEQIVISADARIAELEPFAEIGRRWTADSSLETWFPLTAEIVNQNARDIAELRAKLRSTGRILTCVYCGHEYPQGTPAHGDKVLTDHIAECEKHPMRAVCIERDQLRARLAAAVAERDEARQLYATIADDRDMAEARLAAIDAAPVVAKVVTRIGPDEFPCGTTILQVARMRAGTELIARPAKESSP